MQANHPDQASHRVTVILGSARSSQNLLDLVLPLLSAERAVEMKGVFLEEAAVQHAAELPFVKELCRVTFSVREFNNDQFERALALRMRTARRALAVLARRTGVQHSFDNVRGSAVGLLREMVSGSDVTIFEPLRMISAPMTPPSRLRIPQQRIVVVIDDPEAAGRTLLAASHLSGGRMGRVTVLLTPTVASNDSVLSLLFGDLLPEHPGRTRTIPGNSIHSIVNAVQAEGSALLVLSATSRFMEPETLQILRERVRCPVCLVRRWCEP